MKLYADGADLESIEKLANRVDGFTTNPSLMRNAGITNYELFARDVLRAAEDKPVSFEVLSDDLRVMERQARKIAKWSDRAVVKIPITNSEGISTCELITRLTRDGISINVTALFTIGQIKSALRAMQGPGAILSIFAGRIADTSVDPEPIVRDAVTLSRPWRARVLWASAREVFNAEQAQRCGAEIITMAPALIEKMDAERDRDLDEYSLATVKQFKRDAEGLTL